MSNIVQEISLTPAASQVEQAPHKENADKLFGRRIVDIFRFIEQLQLLNKDCKFGCSFGDMEAISETRKGLNSGIKFKCKMCNIEKVVWTDTTSNSTCLSVNTAAVTGTIGIGAGYSSLEEFLSALNIPCMSKNTYATEHRIISNAWEQCASTEMKRAIEKEKEMAVERGDIDAEGIPLLTVIVDGTWSKRSYKSNYTALSGAVSKFIFLLALHTRRCTGVPLIRLPCILCKFVFYANRSSSPPMLMSPFFFEI